MRLLIVAMAVAAVIVLVVTKLVMKQTQWLVMQRLVLVMWPCKAVVDVALCRQGNLLSFFEF